MKIKLVTAKQQRRPVEVYAVAVDAEWEAKVGGLDRKLRRKLLPEVKRQGFAGKAGEVAVFQTHGEDPAPYVLLVGCAEGKMAVPWPRLAHALIARATDLKASSVVLCLPDIEPAAAVIEQIAETILLGSYRFDQLKSAKRTAHGVESVLLQVDTAGAELQNALKRAQATASAVNLARDLTNLPAGIVTPTYLANEARRLGDRRDLAVRILDVAGMRELGMGAILGVAQGSAEPPAFIELVHRPPGKARKVVAIAGKGITFDSGGLSLKTSGGMEAMKRDMAGSAVVLAVMSAVADFAPEIEVRGYVASSENMPGDRAFKPGDVLKAYNGKTIEVLNTDAEGRLVLADALSYAAAARPDVLIDLATLTGAVRVALGTRYAAIMGSDRDLVAGLIRAGDQCGENLWELPLVSEYRSDLESQIADMKNVGEGSAGTIVAGLFLQEFVGNVPWAHIDFSSTVLTSKPHPGHPRGASGFGVRTLLRYLRGL
ncbi:MAG TPA: leucyl aminopeptidase [Terriglobales bacterium]|nr:leucyl aminopeptidase [Terriglobales bacterium]